MFVNKVNDKTSWLPYFNNNLYSFLNVGHREFIDFDLYERRIEEAPLYQMAYGFGNE